MDIVYLEYYHQLYVNLTFTKNKIEDLNINDRKIFDKKNEFNVEIENLLFILQICMNCTGSNENYIENHLKEFILANNYSQVILSLQRIEKLKLDIIQLINDSSVLKI